MEAREAVRPIRQAFRSCEPGKIEELAATLTRFGAAIEADFAHHYPNDDPAVLWRTRRWRRLLNLINRLPSASYYAEAQADDEDLARAYLARRRDEAAARLPRVSEWNPVLAELVNLTDRVGELIAITVTAHGGGKVNVQPRPRPQTAVERLKTQVRVEQHQRLVSRLLPRRSHQGRDDHEGDDQ